MENVKKAVRLNLDSKTIKMLDMLSEKNAGSKSQAARKAIQDAYERDIKGK
jgi:predicted transcriptional regulator